MGNETPKSLERCCEQKLDWKDFTELKDHRGKVAVCKKCSTLYEQNGETKNIYFAKLGKDYRHLGCGEEIQFISRIHPIWEKGTCGGYGECKNEKMPYCPKCEEKPDSSGSPVYYKPITVKNGVIDTKDTEGVDTN
jgi:hypothetical protein